MVSVPSCAELIECTYTDKATFLWLPEEKLTLGRPCRSDDCYEPVPDPCNAGYELCDIPAQFVFEMGEVRSGERIQNASYEAKLAIQRCYDCIGLHNKVKVNGGIWNIVGLQTGEDESLFYLGKVKR